MNQLQNYSIVNSRERFLYVNSSNWTNYISLDSLLSYGFYKVVKCEFKKKKTPNFYSLETKHILVILNKGQ